MIVVAAIVMIAAPIIGFVVGVSSAIGGADGLASGQPVVNGGTVDLPGDSERVIYFEDTSVAGTDVACTVTGPNGQNIATQPATFGPDVSDDLAIGVGFRTAAAGAHTVDCDLPSGAGSSLLVRPPVDFSAVMGAGVAVLIGLAVGFLAFIVLIIGIVWLVRVNKRIRTGQY